MEQKRSKARCAELRHQGSGGERGHLPQKGRRQKEVGCCLALVAIKTLFTKSALYFRRNFRRKKSEKIVFREGGKNVLQTLAQSLISKLKFLFCFCLEMFKPHLPFSTPSYTASVIRPATDALPMNRGSLNLLFSRQLLEMCTFFVMYFWCYRTPVEDMSRTCQYRGGVSF